MMIKDRQRWFRVHVHLVLRFLLYLGYSSDLLLKIESCAISFKPVFLSNSGISCALFNVLALDVMLSVEI